MVHNSSVQHKKLVIFGATGRTGIPLVEQALAQGHTVIALARDPNKLAIDHERLVKIQGDVMVKEDVARAIHADADAVISVLGPAKNSPDDMMAVAARHIVEAMQTQSVERLIFMTGAGVAMPQDKPKLLNHIIKFALKTLAGSVLAQSEQAVRHIETSGLGWTLVRVPMLTDQPHSGQYRVGWVGVNTGPRLARADAADFILAQLDSEAYLQKAPVISN